MNSIVENKLEILSPSDQTVIGSVTITNPESLDSYFSNARQAQKLWSQVPIKERCQYFYRLRDHLIDHAEEFAQAIAKENGKPAFEALAHEITPVIELITFYTKNTSSLLQEKRIPLHLMKHRKSILNYWPLGVVSVISPWNYPFLLPMGELVMALISGNAVIFKPSEITPLIGLKIQTLFEEAGFPKHLLTTVIGDGKLGSDIISHKPDKVFFTGSVATGKKIMAQAALNLTPVNLELGGKDPFIVLEDANLDYATSAALWGAFSNAGQICASVERILVHESIEKAFTQLYLEKIKKLRVGEDLGAITLPKQKQIYESQLNEAKAHHATFACGGNFSKNGNYLEPTVISGHDIETLSVYRDETFGPVVALTTFKTDEEVISKANASPYALLASVITADRGRAEKIARQLEAGTVVINEVVYTAGLPETPWGGLKDTGFGRKHSAMGLYEFVNVRHIHSPRWGAWTFKSPWWFPYTPAQYQVFKNLILVYRSGTFNKIKPLLKLGSSFIKMLRKEPRL